MKKLKLKGIILTVEVEEKIEDGTLIDLDENVLVSTGTFKNVENGIGVISHTIQEKNYYGNPINEYLYDKITPEQIENALPFDKNLINQKTLVGRKPTPKEEMLIKDHFNKPIQKLDSIMELDSDLEETLFELIVYDISESNKLVFSNVCIITTYDDGEKEVFFSVDKYNIRHGIVYDINLTENFLEFHEDISDLTDLLNGLNGNN